MSVALPVGLDAWIIQDGNYPDFAVGQECSFALEFYAPEPFKVVSCAEPLEPRYLHRGEAEFAVIGKSVYRGDDWWVADFGIPAFTSYAPIQWHDPDVPFEGTVYIGVDPFFYSESFSRCENAPALIFDWRVERIELQTAPFIQQGERMLIRDPEKIGWRDLRITDAWGDDEGRAEYILHCTRLSDQPRRSLRR